MATTQCKMDKPAWLEISPLLTDQKNHVAPVKAIRVRARWNEDIGEVDFTAPGDSGFISRKLAKFENVRVGIPNGPIVTFVNSGDRILVGVRHNAKVNTSFVVSLNPKEAGDLVRALENQRTSRFDITSIARVK